MTEQDFYYSLQRYSSLYRIILARPYSTKIYINQWNRIDLKLVNEFGLTLIGDQSTNCWLQISCQLLQKHNGRISPCKDYTIHCRPLQHDAWDANHTSDITGFQNSADGDFEYMISTKITDPLYIQICPTHHPNQTVKAFPLMIGPLYLHDTPIAGTMNGLWEETTVSRDIFHGYRLQDDSFLVIKEDWDRGTPGKMWDSALVLSHILSDKIMRDPDCFKGKRILDLSAGTGCVGLLIGAMYRVNHSSRKDRPVVTLTDLSEALDLIQQNRRHNLLEAYTNIKPLKWGNYDDVQQVLKEGPLHTIIVSDVLYKPSSFPSLVETLDWLSRDNSDIQIYLGYKRRGLDLQTEQTFFDICGEIFKIQELVDNTSSNEGWILVSDICKETGVNLYQLLRK